MHDVHFRPAGFGIGRKRSGGIVEGTARHGTLPLETFRQIIDQLLTPAKPATNPSR